MKSIKKKQKNGGSDMPDTAYHSAEIRIRMNDARVRAA